MTKTSSCELVGGFYRVDGFGRLKGLDGLVDGWHTSAGVYIIIYRCEVMLVMCSV